MKSDEASTLLLRTANQPASEEVPPFVREIIEALGCLALAITVAGRAIQEGFCKLQTYLEHFEKMWEKRRQSRAGGSAKVRDEFDQYRYVPL
jgi:hypothetical protein